MKQTKDDAWGVNVVERIRVRIMTEAYDIADRGDIEGYNAIKLMCHDVLRIIEAHPLTDEQIKECSYDAEGFMVSRENAMRAVERAHGIGEKNE